MSAPISKFAAQRWRAQLAALERRPVKSNPNAGKVILKLR